MLHHVTESYDSDTWGSRSRDQWYFQRCHKLSIFNAWSRMIRMFRILIEKTIYKLVPSIEELPSRELTYPPQKALLSRWFSELPDVGYVSFLEGNDDNFWNVLKRLQDSTLLWRVIWSWQKGPSGESQSLFIYLDEIISKDFIELLNPTVDGSEIRLTSWGIVYPIIHRVLYIQTVETALGFCPPTVAARGLATRLSL